MSRVAPVDKLSIVLTIVFAFILLKKIAAYEYDCILLDLMLPDENGLDILSSIKRESPQTEVIIVSAKDPVDDKVEVSVGEW